MASSQDHSSSDDIDWSAILAASMEKPKENEATYNPNDAPGIVPFVDRGTDGPQLSEY